MTKRINKNIEMAAIACAVGLGFSGFYIFYLCQENKVREQLIVEYSSSFFEFFLLSIVGGVVKSYLEKRERQEDERKVLLGSPVGILTSLKNRFDTAKDIADNRPDTSNWLYPMINPLPGDSYNDKTLVLLLKLRALLSDWKGGNEIITLFDSLSREGELNRYSNGFPVVSDDIKQKLNRALAILIDELSVQLDSNK